MLRASVLEYCATMANILSISSQVVCGAVGNSVGAFAMQRLGHTVWQIPTVLLSNHPGHGAFSGDATPAKTITALWGGIKAHSWHQDVDAVLTGYIPGPEAVGAIATIVEDLKSLRTDVVYLCDPAIGDEPKGIYVDPLAATAIRDRLLPIADIATPNRFELSWLAGVEKIATARAAMDASIKLATKTVIATSVPGDADNVIANVLTSNSRGARCSASRHAHAPNGTGDLFSSLFFGHLMNGLSVTASLGRATAGVTLVVDASQGRDTLQTIATQIHWADVMAAPVSDVQA